MARTVFLRPSVPLLASILALVVPRVGRAENSLTYKYEDYRESSGRITVETQSALLEQDIGTDFHVKLQGVTDAIAGATPTGQPAPTGSSQVVLTPLHERRKAWNIDLAKQFTGVNLSGGFAVSRESDYVSYGWSLNSLTDFNQKNTTLLVGVAGTDDDVKVYDRAGFPYLKKRSHDVIAGVTQLLDSQTSVTFNVTYGRATGYLADQYKLVTKSIEIVPGLFLPMTPHENRPDHRDKWVALAAVNHTFAELNGAIDASYRFYHDTFGTDAHTLETAWFQKIGKRFVLSPNVRFYEQSAANFYYYDLNKTSIIPTTSGPPSPKGPFYSSDFRLSHFRATTLGLKGIWTITDHVQVDAAVSSYKQHGRDGVTPSSAYVTVTDFTTGLKISW